MVIHAPTATWKRIGIITLLLAVNAMIVLRGAGNLDGTEIARYRNAFLAQGAGESEFDWTPANVPADYLLERVPVPEELLPWVQQLKGQKDSVGKALAIARSLSVKPRYGEPIHGSTITTLNTIVTLGTGYCVDYTKVYSALAYSTGLVSREWAFSFDGFGGDGHIFNEVWDADHQRWFMIDVFHGFYPRDSKNGTPLSALEFRRRLLSAPASILWERLTPFHFAFKSEAEALDYYQRGAREWYLWWGNNSLGYDQQPAVAWASRFGHLPEQIAAIATGTLPKFKVLLTEQNRAAFEHLMWLKYSLLTAASLEVLLLVALMWQVPRLYRESARYRTHSVNVSAEARRDS